MIVLNTAAWLLSHCWHRANGLEQSQSICHSGSTDGSPLLELKYSASPFGFAVVRTDGRKAFPLFNTAGSRLVFKVKWHVLLEVLFSCIHEACQVPSHPTASASLQTSTASCLLVPLDRVPCPCRTSTLRSLQPFLPMQHFMVWARTLPAQALCCGEMASPMPYGHATRPLMSPMSMTMAPIHSSWMSALVRHQIKLCKASHAACMTWPFQPSFHACIESKIYS